MGTKNNPGEFDCYEAAAPDEPMFILLARDAHAPFLVELWRQARAGDIYEMVLTFAAFTSALNGANFREHDAKAREADRCAESMREWSRDNRR